MIIVISRVILKKITRKNIQKYILYICKKVHTEIYRIYILRKKIKIIHLKNLNTKEGSIG